MLRETLYASIGAAALTVDFVTHPQRSQSLLKKAERRGSRIASQYERSLRSLTKDAGSTLEDLRKNPLALFGNGSNGVKAGNSVKAVGRRVRKGQTTRVRARARRNGATTLTVERSAVAS